MSSSRRTQIRYVIIAVVFLAIVGFQIRSSPYAALLVIGTLGAMLLANALFSFFVWSLYFLANLTVGFRFRLLAWWPLKLAREQDGIHFRRNDTSYHTNLLMFPSKIDRLRQRLIFLLLVAPGAGIWTMLSSAFGLYRFALGFYVVPNQRVMYIIQAHPLIMFLSPFLPGLFLAILFLIGMGHLVGALRTHGINNPSARDRIVMLHRRGPLGDRYCALIALSGCSYDGVRPRDWNPILLQHALAVRDDSPDACAATRYAYYVALDRGAADESAAYLDRLLELRHVSPPLDAAVIACEAAYFAAWYRADGTAARDYLMQVPMKPWCRQPRMRAEAATLLAEGRREEAWMLATQAQAALVRANNLGYARAEHDWLAAIMARAAGVAPQMQAVSASA